MAATVPLMNVSLVDVAEQHKWAQLISKEEGSNIDARGIKALRVQYIRLVRS